MKFPMLSLRGRTYYARVCVPLKLQGLFGRKEVWRSLKTADPELAKRLSLTVAQEMRRVFAALEKKRVEPSPTSVAREYQRNTSAIPAQGLGEGESMALSTRLETLQTDPEAIKRLLDSVLLDQGIHVAPSAREAYAVELLRSEIASLKAMISGQPVPEEGPTVMELMESYLSERKLPSQTEREVRAIVKVFVKVVSDKNAPSVQKSDIRAYREHLHNSGLGPATIRKKLGFVSTIFRYGVGTGVLQSNVMDGGLTRVSRQAAQTERRLPFSNDQVKTLLAASADLKGAKRWVTWIAAFTGARVEEIAGLRVQDVKQESGISYFDFQPTAERRLKNLGSARRVPVHPMLLSNGLLDALPKTGRLFPELKANKHGVLSASFGKWWGRFADASGIDDPRLVFHSWRHTVKDALRRVEAPEEIQDSILGHTSSASVGRRYGSGVGLPVLLKWVERISYE